MKNKFFMAIAVIMVTGASMLSATAQNNNIVSAQMTRVGAYVYLQPDVSGLTGDFFNFNVINNTNKTIPAGTKIYWSLGQVKGSKVLSAALAPGQKIFLDSGANLYTSGGAKAWYFQ